MALTRKMLKAMGIEDEKIDQIIEAHTETVDALKQQRDDAQAKAGDADRLREQLEAAQESAGKPDAYKAKYEEAQKALESYKAEVAEKEAAATARALFKAQVESLGITGKRADSVVRATDLSAFEVKDGAYADPEAVRKAIQEDWSDFIPRTHTEGADVAKPPASDGGKAEPKSLADALRQRYETKG